jgi:hypothetical protein
MRRPKNVLQRCRLYKTELQVRLCSTVDSYLDLGSREMEERCVTIIFFYKSAHIHTEIVLIILNCYRNFS